MPPFIWKKTNLIHFTGVNAYTEDELDFSENELELLSEESLIETYGLLGKIQCKLCVEVMRPVVKAIRKDSAKVNSTSLQSFDFHNQISHHPTCVYSVKL